MKSETPIESIESLRAKPATRTGLTPSTERGDDGFEPRYVEVPRRRRAQISAERNLKWGLAVLLLALGVAGAALIIGGARSLLPLVVCLVTATILWVLARLHVFHQRNGVFFAIALICLLGATIPMIERGYLALDRMVHSPSIFDDPIVLTAPGSGPEPAPVLDRTPELAPEPTPPSLVEAFKIKPPTDPGATTVEIIEDTKVMVGRKPYLLRAGDVFAIEDIKDGQVILIANELRLPLSEKAVELVSSKLPPPVATMPPAPGSVPPPASPRVSDQAPAGEMTGRAQEEAIRRYPGIGIKDSPENKIFVERFRELKAERPEFFDEEEWPLYLAEAIAQEQDWKRVP